ncbi:MAG: DUF531 family protein [Thermoplasmata archaeon]|nr:MAG: DUF531 family protein [Thermoplasmata archaeon]
MREHRHRRPVRLGRMTLALYNSYDPVRLAEAHRRALARAAPVAQAYDANLATLGFPFDRELRTPVEVARWLSTTTSIGKGGELLLEMAEAGRFGVFDMLKKGFPPQLGTVVATTSKPDPARRVDAEWAAGELSHGSSLCMLFGLGPKGLPKDVIGFSKHHLDVTRKGVALETCTAMGAVPAAIAEAMRPMVEE